MKKSMVPACGMLVLSAVIAVGSFSFLSPCVHADGSFAVCHWAGRMLTGLGCVTGVLAVLAMFPGRHRRGVYASVLPVCVLGILTPGFLIDLCHMSTMRCRALMQPAMRILFSALLVLAGIGFIMSAGKEKT